MADSRGDDADKSSGVFKIRKELKVREPSHKLLPQAGRRLCDVLSLAALKDFVCDANGTLY